MKNKRTVSIFDTTLRDGSQAERINLTIEDKILLAKKLDKFGVDYIEGGWPMSTKDVEFFERMKSVKLQHAKLTAFGSTHHKNFKPSEDPNLKALVASGAKVMCIFGKTWDLHVTTALGISLERNIELIEGSIRFLKEQGFEVIYDAEHFFDGYKTNTDYALRTLKAAVKAGADNITLCDTNGGCLPFEIEEIINTLKKNTEDFNIPLGIHCHNDAGCAAANTLVAVHAGCVLIQGTINGFGERCGNVNLCTVLPALKLKMGISFTAMDNLPHLTEFSHFVYEIANLEPDARDPYTGKSSFAHKGGIHVSAVLKESRTYEHIDPTEVGNSRRVLISDQAGKSSVLYKANELGLTVDATSETAKEIIKRVKELESRGFEFENADASFELLIQKITGKHKPVFDLKHFRLIIERTENNSLISEGVVKIAMQGVEEFVVATGNGPVNAIDSALRKALEKQFPQINEMQLIDYKVRVLGQKSGTDSLVRVLIESKKGDKTWVTVGVSENIIEASWEALVDSIEYMIMKKY